MKGLLLALALLPVACAAQTVQIVEPSTPPPLTTFVQEFGADGSVYSLTSAGGLQRHFNLPFHLDFDGGYQIVLGKRTSQMGDLLNSVPAFGLEFFGQKGIGGDGAFVRLGVRVLFDGSQEDSRLNGPPRTWVTGTLTIGYAAKVK